MSSNFSNAEGVGARDNVPDLQGSDERSEAARTIAILRKRAERLAREPKHARSARDLVQITKFTVAGGIYGFESSFVREVFTVRSMCRVPCTPSFISGITNLRGTIYSIVDLRHLLELCANGDIASASAIVLSNGDMEFGVLCDRILGVEALSFETLTGGSVDVNTVQENYLKCITTDGMAVLDAQKMLRDPSLIVDVGDGRHVKGDIGTQFDDSGSGTELNGSSTRIDRDPPSH